MAMTGGALKSMSQMPFVGEVDEVGKSLEACPGYRHPLLPVVEQNGGVPGFCGEIPVASHAELHRWNAGCGGSFGKPMTVKTVNVETSRMQFVAEAQRLHVCAGQVGASL
jgi:hypothetical protein